ncbi:MAG: hypothetical protein V3U35_08705, partial [Candidatus Neomarinimicrobiota bacterium]
VERSTKQGRYCFFDLEFLEVDGIRILHLIYQCLQVSQVTHVRGISIVSGNMVLSGMPAGPDPHGPSLVICSKVILKEMRLAAGLSAAASNDSMNSAG